MVFMQKPSVIESPSGGAPEKAPRCDLTGTEGCGGEKSVSWLPWMFSGYKSIYRRKKQVGGATRSPRGWGCAYPPGRALLPRGCLVASLTSTPSLLGCVCSKKDPREGLIPFGFRLIFLFCETLKQAKKNSNQHGAFGQQVSPKNNIKVYNKAH